MSARKVNEIKWTARINDNDYNASIYTVIDGYPVISATAVSMMLTGKNETEARNHYNKVLQRCNELTPVGKIEDSQNVSCSAII